MDKIEEGYAQGIDDMLRLEKERGLSTARQLVKYQGVTSLTRVEAMEITATIWPDAPEADKVAAAMLCATYGLNPLASHIFLIPYEDKRTGKTTWSRVWGIRAKRLLATRRGTFSYLDMSPRLMTNDEQVKVWGEVDKVNICCLTHLKDMRTGAEVYGYGKWPRDTQPKGTNKGNSQANMASIRSESQAIDRLRPAEMPSGFTIADEDFVDAEVREIPQPAIADLAAKYADTTDGTIATEQGQGAVTGDNSEGKVATSRIDADWFNETMTIIRWSPKTAKSWIASQLRVTVPADATLLEVLNSLDDKGLKTFTDHIRLMRESAGK